MEKNLRPNSAEKEFLNIAYNRFFDIFEEVMDDSFWRKRDQYRLSRIKDGFEVYAELLNYEPIKWVIEQMKRARPPMEAEISSELFKFIRNVISHFPFFDQWNDIWIKKSIINWNKDGQSIDRFLLKYSGKTEVKYRFFEKEKRKMTYLSINFPQKYSKNQKIYLKDILSEKDGLKFSFILMRNVLSTQIEMSEESN